MVLSFFSQLLNISYKNVAGFMLQVLPHCHVWLLHLTVLTGLSKKMNTSGIILTCTTYIHSCWISHAIKIAFLRFYCSFPIQFVNWSDIHFFIILLWGFMCQGTFNNVRNWICHFEWSKIKGLSALHSLHSCKSYQWSHQCIK